MDKIKSDIEIARSAKIKPIKEVLESIGVRDEKNAFSPIGHHIAKLELEQSQKDVQIAQSELAPSATISFESSRTDDLSSTYDERDKEILKATVTWPIFSGGKNYSKLKKNKNLKIKLLKVMPGYE